jgi:hypothetical protein
VKRLYGVPSVALLFTGGDLAHVHARVVRMHDRAATLFENAITFRGMPAPHHDVSQ